MLTKEEKLVEEIIRAETAVLEIPKPKSTADVGVERTEERKLEATAPKTGYNMLDSFIGGWIPGHLYVLSGETNVGKTATACNFAVRVATQQKRVLYFALEPDATVIEYIAGIYHKKRWENITDEDILTEIEGLHIYTKDSHPDLKDLLFTIENSERYDLIIVDHIGYFTSSSDDKRGKTDQESDAIKRIVSSAKKKKTAIMIIAHPRKSTTTRRSKHLGIHDISGSAAFQQDATDVLMLHRFAREGNKEYETALSQDGYIALLKVKVGKSGETVPIRFIADSPVMLEQEEAGVSELAGLGIE